MNSKRLKVLVLFLVILALGSIILAACSRPGTITNTGTTPTASTGGGGGGGVAVQAGLYTWMRQTLCKLASILLKAQKSLL